MTIEEVEAQLEQGLLKLRSPEYKALQGLLQPLISKGFHAQVSLVDSNGRKKRRSASAEKWSPELGGVHIKFVRESAEPATAAVLQQEKATPIHSTTGKQTAAPDPIADLVRALDRAESRPGFQFIALKWFRDVALPAETFDWVRSDSGRQAVLREAIERRFILINKVPNPKSPQFPVTAIRLNRLLPEVRSVLGGKTADSDFDPVEIHGELLSTTVLRERR
jgi:hypothetical protein